MITAKTSNNCFGRFIRYVCICFFFLLHIAAVSGQSIEKPQILNSLAVQDTQSGRVELVQPAQIENLLKLHIANNKLQKGIQGYRIRIFSQSGQTARQKAENTKVLFMKSFPGMNASMEYNDPNFQILVGSFRTYTEAYHEKKKVEKVFPVAFIVSEIIEINK